VISSLDRDHRATATVPLILQTVRWARSACPTAPPAPRTSRTSRRVALYGTRGAKGEGTRRAYHGAWHHYERWCPDLGRKPLAADPDTIAMYVVRCADQGCAVSSIHVHLAAIKTGHLLAGLLLDLRHPRLAMVAEGVTRSPGIRTRRKAAPAVPGVLRLLLAARTAPDEPTGARPGDAAARLRRCAAPLRVGRPDPRRRRDGTQPRPAAHHRPLEDRPVGAGQRVAMHANPAEPGWTRKNSPDTRCDASFSSPGPTTATTAPR
jgi:hypothetical protein